MSDLPVITLSSPAAPCKGPFTSRHLVRYAEIPFFAAVRQHGRPSGEEHMEDHIVFDDAHMELRLLDQRLLPTEERTAVCRTVDEVIDALKTMIVRGAPAIGVTAGFGAVLALARLPEGDAQGDGRQAAYDRALEKLADARPTAVNLRWAVERIRRFRQAHAALSADELLPLLLEEAHAMQREDIAICRAIGAAGQTVLAHGQTVMTHCNAGALATAGYGTALGVIRAAVEAGKHIRVIANETRPFLQGARLTAWELQRDGIPVTIACDNACALLMGRGMVDAVVVGADRIAANGDTANKIGTCGVAMLAQAFGIPFYVAAPLSTIDPHTADGSGIPIEERPAAEVRQLGGRPVCPEGVPVYNFAFDVTPAHYIAGIITEKGILQPPFTASIAAALSVRA